MVPPSPADYARVDALRAASACAPASHALTFARSLNGLALELASPDSALRCLREAQYVLDVLIAAQGASPDRVHHLVMVLANQAQLAGFAGDVSWTDLAFALDSAAEAVRWQRELLNRPDAAAHERETLAEVLLLEARVLAACAQVDEAIESFREAESMVRAGGLESEWGSVVRTVGGELGLDVSAWGGALGEHDRVRRWFWYAR